MTCVEIRDPRPDRARSRGLLFLASLLVLMSTAPELRSQQAVPPMPLSPGARVRVSVRLDSPAVVGGVYSPTRTKNRVLVGSLASADSAALLIHSERGDSARVPFAAVSRLEGSRGPGACRGGMRRVGCVVGLGVAGALAGGLVGAAMGKATQPDDCFECYNVIAGGALGGLLGGTVGTIAGALVGRERWQRVPLRSSP